MPERQSNGQFVLSPNYAINPTPELDLRSNRAVLPARVIAALGFRMRTFVNVLLAILVAIALSGCCSPSSESGAERARGLTQPELESLYSFMEKHKDELIEWGSGGEPLPEELAAIGVLYGDVGHLNRLVFGGCMDDKSTLIFEGLRDQSARKILLIPGERKEPEILWRAEVD